ncbi:TRAP transporter small permease [Jannaschia aquimarina]|uniref:TRAP transporter small permease protein n=1 Tax=Jannaschia aquimarina TaxID=935700 RepID=A0A0D1EG15_9RHOB|nr:TRAP transporter small permease [Jannaschia aquimarina]KIT16619.1 Tripartite ATP-independent periplasmic transporter, DctQ component [Jannaschia aquimarina]SNS94138.1 TRAP-type C4-dicarboxylate transport system, small permease component [Jannaschia aquimarina]
MGGVVAIARALGAVNAALLAVGRWLGIAAIGAMVIAILVQVFWRYVLNDPLPWPEEAARFLMLWMTGLVAPTAFRRGGFVAIDMVQLALPRLIGGLLTLVLLGLSLLVLVTAARIGWAEVTGFSGRFATSSLYYPTAEGWEKMPRSWMMGSILVGMVLLSAVAAELILRQIAILGGRGDDLPEIPMAVDIAAGAE